jgi:hypothetical protein
MNAAARIEEAFAELGTGKDDSGKPIQALHIDVPYCDHKGRAKTTNVHEAVAELLADFQKPVREAMFKVLQESDCPHVRALRSVMCSQWVRSHADELEAAYDLEAAA